MKTHTHFPTIQIFAMGICALVLWPLFALLLQAFGTAHFLTRAVQPLYDLWQYTLPNAAINTFIILFFAMMIGIFFGAINAAFLHLSDIKYRGLLALLCIIPLIMPSFLSSLGIIMALDSHANIAGIFTLREFITSPYGAGVIFGLSLSPYVFLICTAYLAHIDLSCLSAAATLGIKPRKIAVDILLPLLRPACIGGGALIAMETLNDIGTASFLGVNTLTTTALSQWVTKSDLHITSLIALIVLCLAFGILAIERNSRKKLIFVQDANIHPRPPIIHFTPLIQTSFVILCILPFLCVFIIPLWQFIYAASKTNIALQSVFSATFNSLQIAMIVALFCCCTGLIILNARAITCSKFIRSLLRIATIGYAIPGTLIALGLLLGLPFISNAWDTNFPTLEGSIIRILLVNSPILMIIALCIRFLPVAHSPLEAANASLSPMLESAARTLKATKFEAFFTIRVPLLMPTLLSAGLMVAIDTIKELPATLLLRPFNFETLPTLIYIAAHREAYEEAAPAALILILCCMPILFIVFRILQKRS